jgi:hypothetical protein
MLATLVLATDLQAEPKMYSASLILHDFANDTTSGKTPPYATYTLQALPLGAYCNPGNRGKTCDEATLHGGAPLTGSGSAMLQGSALPRGFVLRRGEIGRETSGSLPPYPGVLYTTTAAKLENDQAQFGAGDGPGSFSFVPLLGSGSTRVVVAAGKNQFGGIMRLMGKFGTHNAGSTLGGGRWYGNFSDWGLQVAGGSYAEMKTVRGTFSFTSPPVSYRSVALVTGFPWTTGRVSVSAAGGSGFPTHLVRSGYDNRTPDGVGTIQMVTPRLTHWAAGSHWGDVAVLRIQFAPEPEGWVLLAAGLSLVAVLHHSGAGRSRRGQKSREH